MSDTVTVKRVPKLDDFRRTMLELPTGRHVVAAQAALAALQKMGAEVQPRPALGESPRAYHSARLHDGRVSYGPERFTWGKVRKVHRIEESEDYHYAIVESQRYLPGPYVREEQKERQLDIKSAFHPFVDGRDTGHSYGSLDEALLACVAWRADYAKGGVNRAANSRAPEYMARLIELDG